jgi:hypothetical protein
MIQYDVTFQLPSPWSGQTFATRQLGTLNFLVGPNGSGKSRFAEALKGSLPDCRLLGTDRLAGMEKNPGFGGFGDNLAQGLQKQLFDRFKNAGVQFGNGVDAIVILEERLDVRVRLEATLSRLFDRWITLEWDSGYLLPKAILGSKGSGYRLDRDECHGIKELLVLLTHLYNDEYKFLIIDEPELHLHPQYQAFLMQEIRKVAGNPMMEAGRKGIFLITHSPFILDFRSIEDVRSVISFDIKQSVPRSLFEIAVDTADRLAGLVPRLNAHHKQLFFSDNPVFVEGALDAQLVQLMQEARGLSVAGAGSCVIDAGGCEEVNKFVELCRLMGKHAYFLYDLDSLFMGNLRSCIRQDETVASFLAEIGVGRNFGRYCGELDRILSVAVKAVMQLQQLPVALASLRRYLDEIAPDGLPRDNALVRARIAILVQLGRERESLLPVLPVGMVAEIEGRLKQIATALEQKNVLLLTKGAPEHHLPLYLGDPFRLDANTKLHAVNAEAMAMAAQMTDEEMSRRYGSLYTAICKLPGKQAVDIDAVLTEYLSRFIVELQNQSLKRPEWGVEEHKAYLAQHSAGRGRLFELRSFERGEGKAFAALVIVLGTAGGPDRMVHISHATNAGMRDFALEPVDTRRPIVEVQ